MKEHSIEFEDKIRFENPLDFPEYLEKLEKDRKKQN